MMGARAMSQGMMRLHTARGMRYDIQGGSGDSEVRNACKGTAQATSYGRTTRSSTYIDGGFRRRGSSLRLDKTDSGFLLFSTLTLQCSQYLSHLSMICQFSLSALVVLEFLLREVTFGSREKSPASAPIILFSLCLSTSFVVSLI